MARHPPGPEGCAARCIHRVVATVHVVLQGLLLHARHRYVVQVAQEAAEEASERSDHDCDGAITYVFQKEGAAITSRTPEASSDRSRLRGRAAREDYGG